MRAREDIIRALRCIGTVHETVDCTDCPYLLDAAEMLEADTETISALIDDRKYYMEKYEGLKSRVPRHNCVPPEEGADDDEA